MKYIDIGQREGATLHSGGKRHGTEGFFVEPAIFTDVKPSMAIVQEEIFGPGAFIVPCGGSDASSSQMRLLMLSQSLVVVAVAKFNDREELIALANDTVYGLTASVFTRDITNALVTANALHAGTVWINMLAVTEKNVAFGGFKREYRLPRLNFMRGNRVRALIQVLALTESGAGRDLGEEALKNYTEVKAVHVNLTGAPPF